MSIGEAQLEGSKVTYCHEAELGLESRSLTSKAKLSTLEGGVENSLRYEQGEVSEGSR